MREFAKGQTRKEKDDWAAKYINAWPGTFSIGLTLHGGRENMLGHEIRPRVAPKRPAPPELVESARKMSEAWFRTQSIDAAIAFVDWSELANQFNKADQAALDGASQQSVILWCRRFMTMFLIDDHSIVNLYGHGDPKSARYREMPEAPPREGPFRARESLTPPIAFSDFFFETAGSTGNEYALVFQPEGLPHDAICLIWRSVNGDWKIVRMFALVG